MGTGFRSGLFRGHFPVQWIIIIIIIIHEFQSDASPEELQSRCSVTVFSPWLWPVTRTAERPDKQLSLQSAPKTVDSRQRRDRCWQCKNRQLQHHLSVQYFATVASGSLVELAMSTSNQFKSWMQSRGQPAVCVLESRYTCMPDDKMLRKPSEW